MRDKKIISYRALLCILSVLVVSGPSAEAAEIAAEVSHCLLDVVVDTEKSEVRGVMVILTEREREITIYPNDARISELSIDGKAADIDEVTDGDVIVVTAGRQIRLRYEISMKDSDDNRLSDDEIVFKDGWYPMVDGFCTYEVHAVLPPGFIAISEGDDINTIQQDQAALFSSRFDRPYSSVISLVASKRFVVSRNTFDDIEIYTYFFKEDAGQAARFIEGAKRYLAMYQPLVGKYPYRRFSIVENSLPSAYSMPTFILMTKNYIKEEKVEDTPLGHEIAHQWFGNSVFADYEQGNWNEGLTIYFADHFYEEKQQEDANCRKRILMGHENYVRENNVFPLSKFMERFDYASRSIGYGKSAMVFHMLRRQYGDEAFYKAIRRFVQDYSFQVATWEDLKKTFEITTGQDLSDYFQQWVYEVGTPELELTDIQAQRKGGGYEVNFTVLQQGSVYRLFVPVTFYFAEGKKTEHLTIAGRTNRFSYAFDMLPTEIVLDENYDVFRKLTIPETPPLIERLVTDEKTIVVASAMEKSLYGELIDAFSEKGSITKFMNQRPDVTQRRYAPGGRIRNSMEQKVTDKGRNAARTLAWERRRKGATSHPPDDSPAFRRQNMQREAGGLKDTDISSASLLVMGADNPLLRRLELDVPAVNAGFSLVVQKNPLNPRKVVAVVVGKSREEIALAQEQITDYRKYSALSFDQGKLVGKTIAKAENGIRKNVKNQSNP